MSGFILIRIRSKEGTKRLETSPDTSLRTFYRDVENLLGGIRSLNLYKDQDKKIKIERSSSSTLEKSKIKHGDMLYAFFESNSEENIKEEKSIISLLEDPIDVELSKLDGKIPRPPSENCRHISSNSKCIHCTPLEPFDESYQESKEIKHLSFHSYLRKLKSNGKFAILEEISCSIKPGCLAHAPYPEGICSNCQPSAVTLNRQKYRHVDNVMFENPKIVEQFLDFWKSTGKQRIGFLYGKYEIYKDVPLGIKAVVSAIYEPPQEGTRDSVSLEKDDKEEHLEIMAKSLGLVRLGWILTDLLPMSDGKVKHIRHGESHFLSAQEIITAATYQLNNPNISKASSSSFFGSKFVTVIVSGNSENQISLEGYQVSNQCMALVKDDLLLPTKDAPELGYIKESSSDQYVPEVSYKAKDEYGNEVVKGSRPLPVEYLIVNVPVSHPLEPIFTFPIGASVPFPIENRPLEGHLQDFGALATHRKKFEDSELPLFFRDFHVLFFLYTLTIVPLREHMEMLLEAVRNVDPDMIRIWANSQQWQTVEQLILYS